MPDFVITIQGLPEIINRIAGLPESVQEEVSAEIIDSVQRISAMQKRLAPKDQGGLANSIGYSMDREGLTTTFELFANSEYAAYQEFGTRNQVFIPQIVGLEELAQEAHAPGISTGLTAKEAIFAWCKRVGIDERYWYPVYLKIMIIGIAPQPFFIGPFIDEQPELIQRIERVVNDYTETI